MKARAIILTVDTNEDPTTIGADSGETDLSEWIPLIGKWLSQVGEQLQAKDAPAPSSSDTTPPTNTPP